MSSDQYWVYILMNRGKSVIYIGVTNDLQRRVGEHRRGDAGHPPPGEATQQLEPGLKARLDSRAESRPQRPLRHALTQSRTGRGFYCRLQSKPPPTLADCSRGAPARFPRGSDWRGESRPGTSGSDVPWRTDAASRQRRACLPPGKGQCVDREVCGDEANRHLPRTVFSAAPIESVSAARGQPSPSTTPLSRPSARAPRSNPRSRSATSKKPGISRRLRMMAPSQPATT